MSPVRIVYFDDQTLDLDAAPRFQERLSQSPHIHCELLPPPSLDGLDNLAADPPDLFLIDYELSLGKPDDRIVSYQGSTLADALRDRIPDRPIVLLTRQTILKHLSQQRRRQLTQQMQMFDELLLKSVLDEDLAYAQYLLISLSSGFEALRSVENKQWADLANLVEAGEAELETLGEASPPLGKDGWIVTEMAFWIREVVLAFPGILYNPLYAATSLGISVQSFAHPDIQELLQSARYTGVFAPQEGRWWKDRLLKVAKQLTLDADVRGPLHYAFARAIAAVVGLEPTPATCVWDHTPVADAVCHVLRQPVKLGHSLRYYPDRRPEVMDDARVSFRAIRESDEFNEAYLDAEGRRLVDRIQEMAEI